LEFSDGEFSGVAGDLKVAAVGEGKAGCGRRNSAGEDASLCIEPAEVGIDLVELEQVGEQVVAFLGAIGAHLRELGEGREKLARGFEVLFLGGGGELDDATGVGFSVEPRRFALLEAGVKNEAEGRKDGEKDQREQADTKP
jgi:hypothetical protein